ncbi:MAG: alpha-2-macroglobulin, partial [Myxococcales bacterium]
GGDVEVNVGPNSVTGIYFPVKVVKVGWHDFTVIAYGSQMSDGIRRSIEVLPDGLEQRNAESGRLDGPQSVTVNIPEEAIDGASKVWVKVYPGLFSQVVEGLDSMLQMPSGCFEQTSSSTYPNILVLDYMVQTGQITPEIELRARDYVSQGYQRLLSYEVSGGGFEWFGSPPAHRILTAYGLLEFYDMSKVHDVDEAVIQRTQTWLASLQESDGSYDIDAGGIHEGAVNNFTNSLLRTTAYITYALVESGYTGEQVAKGASWIKQNLSEATDNYTLGLIAMVLGTLNPNDPALNGVLDDLYDARIEDEDGKVHWGQEAQTEMYGEGSSAELETTSLIGQALIRANAHMDLIPGMLDWLVSKKGSFGEWSTTQGTIQALRFMISTLGAQTESADATIVVSANGQAAGALTVNDFNSDVLQLVDLTQFAHEGANTVDLAVTGSGNIMYSVVSSYWLPRQGDPYGQGGPLTVTIAYDKTTLEVDDIVTATATIANHTDGAVLMVLVDIGLPPGFDLIPDQLNEQVATTDLQRWEQAGRQLILYIERVAGNDSLDLTYQMKARFPMEGSSGPASASPYYEPEAESTTPPTTFSVAEAE